MIGKYAGGGVGSRVALPPVPLAKQISLQQLGRGFFQPFTTAVLTCNLVIVRDFSPMEGRGVSDGVGTPSEYIFGTGRREVLGISTYPSSLGEISFLLYTQTHRRV